MEIPDLKPRPIDFHIKSASLTLVKQAPYIALSVVAVLDEGQVVLWLVRQAAGQKYPV